MATNIKEIIDELDTIATAFDAVNTFVFGYPSEVNEQPAKNYPAIYINSDFTGQTIERDSGNGLPNKRQYNLSVIFWDTYTITDKTTLDKQSKYSDIEIIADKYFAEVQRRVEREQTSSTPEFYIGNFETLTGSYVQNQNNDKLIGIIYPLVIIADSLQCTTGTFSY